jgi:hypothetical protein
MLTLPWSLPTFPPSYSSPTPIHFIRYTTVSKSPNHQFWRDLMPPSWSTGTMVFTGLLYCPSWCQNIVPYQDPVGMQLFQMMVKDVFCRMCNYKFIPSGMTTVSIHCMNHRYCHSRRIQHEHFLFPQQHSLSPVPDNLQPDPISSLTNLSHGLMHDYQPHMRLRHHAFDSLSHTAVILCCLPSQSTLQ